MSRFDITLGMLAILGSVAIIALIGMGEPARMPAAMRGFEVRKVETGAAMFAQYCGNCHGPNASGGVCPPLDATSGLHGGDIGPGIAWRLEDLGWDVRQPYEYVYGVISSGRNVSTRPDQYPGNRVATSPQAMAMPAWSQRFGGPLRDDQIADLAAYIVAFRDAVPADATPRPKAAATAAPVLGATEGVTATGGITSTEGVTVTGGVTTTGAVTTTSGVTGTTGARPRTPTPRPAVPATGTP
jgi:mono/diheme cytochrome c family protein